MEWATEALDEVRREVWRNAYSEAKTLKKAVPVRRGRPAADNVNAQAAKLAQERADQIKGSTYALGKAPEHLTANQQLRLEMIAKEDPRLYRAYRIKEKLRLLLKLSNVEEAAKELKDWLWWASHSRIPAMCELSKKVRRHYEHILNTIRLSLSNARTESTNNKIKLVVRKAYGFRNIENLLDMVYLVCSNLKVPLPNRSKTTSSPQS